MPTGLQARYNESTGKCVDSRGETAYNKGQFVECGFINKETHTNKDLTGANLRGLFVAYSDISHAKLDGADLTGAMFLEADASYSSLQDAKLVDVLAAKLDLTSADAQRAIFIGKFENVDLTMAKLQGAVLSDARAMSYGARGRTSTWVENTWKWAEINHRTVLPFSLDKVAEYLMFMDADGSDMSIDTLGGQPARIELEWISAERKLTGHERALVASDLRGMSSFNFAKSDTWFDRAFGADVGNSIIRYIDDRFDYIFSGTSGGDDNTIASNPSISTWMVASIGQYAKDNGLRLSVEDYWEVNGVKRTVTTNFDGAMKIGKAYVAGKNYYIERMKTLIHEARHSDCTTPLTAADAKAAISAKNIDSLIETMTQRSCGHMHAKCPVGHDLAGQYACDSGAWGAYAFGAIFFEKLAKDCSDGCSEVERQIALLGEKEAKTRVLKVEEVWGGQLGTPSIPQAIPAKVAP